MCLRLINQKNCSYLLKLRDLNDYQSSKQLSISQLIEAKNKSTVHLFTRLLGIPQTPCQRHAMGVGELCSRNSYIFFLLQFPTTKENNTAAGICRTWDEMKRCLSGISNGNLSHSFRRTAFHLMKVLDIKGCGVVLPGRSILVKNDNRYK